VYEASGRFGGNADTVQFQLGYNMFVNPPVPYARWVDMGVNDFNKSAYVNIVGVMNQIGFTGYAPLLDTTSYYTLDGSIAYTQGNSSLFTIPLTVMPAALQAASDAFMTQAALDAQNPIYANYTVRQYIEEIFSQNAAYDPGLGPLIIYPRVNGMYFTDEVAPSELPLRAVMHYYAIQEGAGGLPPQRMYFVGGASAWIDALIAYMTQIGINFVPNFQAQLQYNNNAWNLFNAAPGVTPTGNPIVPDAVVVATHADVAAQLIQGGASAAVMSCLARVKYLNGMSVAHTFTGMMPPDYNAWSTYNILIHPQAQYLKPYTISYVCNFHQNDGANPGYNYFGLPLFFITVNPPVPIPTQYVLTDTNTGQPAVAELRHNVLNFDCLSAQVEIQTYQGVNNLYFAGGWTLGAGLHEECWEQGMAIAQQIATGVANNDHHYDASRGPDKYAPAYMRRLLKQRS
jgi:predicted NAD/FAD-binding protein